MTNEPKPPIAAQHLRKGKESCCHWVESRAVVRALARAHGAQRIEHGGVTQQARPTAVHCDRVHDDPSRSDSRKRGYAGSTPVDAPAAAPPHAQRIIRYFFAPRTLARHSCGPERLVPQPTCRSTTCCAHPPIPVRLFVTGSTPAPRQRTWYVFLRHVVVAGLPRVPDVSAECGPRPSLSSARWPAPAQAVRCAGRRAAVGNLKICHLCVAARSVRCFQCAGSR